MKVSRQEYWSGLLFPSPGDLPNQGSNPGLLHFRLILSHPFQGFTLEALLCLGAIKIGYQPEKGADSPLSRPTALTLINSILLSFCLVSGNSFPTRTQTMTIICLSQAFVISSPFVVEPSSSSQSNRPTEAKYLITAVDF